PFLLYTLNMHQHLRFEITIFQRIFIALTFVVFANIWHLKAQVLPVGTPILEDKYRRDQLLGLVDSSVSFTIRPLSALALGRTNVFVTDSLTESQGTFYSLDGEGYVQLMPASVVIQANSEYPYGWNDGPM